MHESAHEAAGLTIASMKLVPYIISGTDGDIFFLDLDKA